MVSFAVGTVIFTYKVSLALGLEAETAKTDTLPAAVAESLPFWMDALVGSESVKVTVGSAPIGNTETIRLSAAPPTRMSRESFANATDCTAMGPEMVT